MSIISRLFHLSKCANQAKRESGIGYFQQVAECLLLARAPNLVGPAEYFDYRLYDPALSKAEKKQFLGYKAERIYARLNQVSWHGTANDKVLFEQVMITSKLEIPKTLAIYHPWRMAGKHCDHVRNAADLERFLTNNKTRPLFVKPIHGLFGRGTELLAGYEPETRLVLTQGQGKVPLDQFHAWVETNSRVGMLFQAVLEPSQEVRKVCGERLSSVRMIVLIGESGPTLFRANWKLCTGKNIMDNTEGWTNGNVVAAVDHRTGLIQGAFRGIDGAQIPTSTHPDTQAQLLGLKVPNWEDMKAYVENAAKAFPGLRFQAWDIAATSDGVCAIELNLATLHTVYATQLVSHQGFLDETLARELAPYI